MSPLEPKTLYIKQRFMKISPETWGKAKHAAQLVGLNLTEWLIKIIDVAADKEIEKSQRNLGKD
jgi:hypothetical protein